MTENFAASPEPALTLKEICRISGLSLNSVKRRIERLGIKPCGKARTHPHGSANLYQKEDADKICSLPRQRERAENKRTKKAAVYYRVSVLDGPCWYVKHAGLGITAARKYGRGFLSLGLKVRITGSDGKVFYLRNRKNESA